METENNKGTLSIALVLIAIVLGLVAPGLLLADFGPPMVLRLIFVALPLIIIPFMIGWLTPSLWWLAGAGAAGLLFLAIVALLTAPPQTLEEFLIRAPLLIPILSTLFFAFLGRTVRKRMLRRRV